MDTVVVSVAPANNSFLEVFILKPSGVHLTVSSPVSSPLEPKRGGRDHDTDEAFAVLDVVEEMALEKGCTPGQLALAWCKDQPGITSPIVGPRTMEQMEDNLGAVKVEVTDEDRERLDTVAAPGRAIVPYYEADFGPHEFRW